jgi:hypothetical protein
VRNPVGSHVSVGTGLAALLEHPARPGLPLLKMIGNR